MQSKIINYPVKKTSSVSEVYTFKRGKKVKIPLFLCRVSAGYPSQADEYVEK